MNNVFRILVFSFIFQIIFSSVSISQNLYVPKKYDKPYKGISLEQNPDEKRGSSDWIVMVTDNNARARQTIGSVEQGRALKFGELFHVIEEQGTNIKIARDRIGTDRNSPGRFDVFGWVNKNDVLLWRHCLVNRESGIFLKGLILNTSRAVTSGNVSFETVQSYLDPSMLIPTTYTADMYEIFYIYKYSPRHNSVLLARKPDYNPDGSLASQSVEENIFIGWVDLDKVVEWDHRMALEPNPDEVAITERRDMRVRSSVMNFSNQGRPEKCALDFSRSINSAGCDVVWDNDLWDSQTGEIKKRKSSYWRRFPIIENLNDEVFKIMVMGELNAENGSISTEVDAVVKQKLNTVIDKARNLNVVFVIDGTESMEPYYTSVMNAVSRIMDVFQSSGQQYKTPRYGYVIYRDHEERERVIETQQLTTNAGQLVNRLRQVRVQDYYDSDTPEAVFLGLRAAFKNVLQDKDETNIIIHLGDAGNHYRNDDSQVPLPEIVNLMVDYKAFYVGFQVHHGSHEAYRHFPVQIAEILSKAASKQYENWINMLGMEAMDARPVLTQESNNIQRVRNGAPMMIMSMDRNQRIDIGRLENEITKAVLDIDNYVENVVMTSRKMLEEGRGINIAVGESSDYFGDPFAPGVYNMLLRMDIDKDTISHYYSRNLQWVFEGYAPMYHQSVSRPLFTTSILLSNIEFMKIVVSMRRLVDATLSISDKRSNLYAAWIELLNRHEGLDFSADLGEFTLEEAAQRLTGIPAKAGMLKDLKLKDIRDKSVFPDDMLRLYINQLNYTYSQLELISNTPSHEFSFRSNDILYYWLPIDKLP